MGAGWRAPRGALPLTLLAALGLFAAQSLPGLLRESVTYDEPAAIGSAYLAYRTGDLRLFRDMPPLLGLFITLPIYLTENPPLPPLPPPDQRDGHYRFGDALLHDSGADTLTILRAARIPVLALSLLLGAAIILWARVLAGDRAALLAAVLFAFSPNLLAHSRIAANDMTCTIFAFLAVASYERVLANPGRWRATGAGVLLGMALTAKLTALFILPVYPVLFVARWHGQRTQRRKMLAASAVVAVVGFASLGALLAGRFDYGRYLSAVGRIYELGHEGYLFYLAGHFSPDPWWYYYLFAMLTKMCSGRKT